MTPAKARRRAASRGRGRRIGDVALATTHARRRFSNPGGEPTDYERELLANSTALEDHWVAVGRRIGIDALFALLDELGSLVVSVPTRESFVGRLYLPVRDAEIARLSLRHTDAEIAEALGLRTQVVRRARARVLRTRRGER